MDFWPLLEGFHLFASSTRLERSLAHCRDHAVRYLLVGSTKQFRVSMCLSLSTLASSMSTTTTPEGLWYRAGGMTERSQKAALVLRLSPGMQDPDVTRTDEVRSFHSMLQGFATRVESIACIKVIALVESVFTFEVARQVLYSSQNHHHASSRSPTTHHASYSRE